MVQEINTANFDSEVIDFPIPSFALFSLGKRKLSFINDSILQKEF